MSARADLDRVRASLEQQPAPGRCSTDDLGDLPPTARRCLTAAIAEGTPRFSATRITMDGEIRLGPRWIRFTAVELLAPQHGFVWSARTRLGISGSDHYASGDGGMLWKLFGLLPVMRAGGVDVSRSARGRAAGEAVWLPTMLSPAVGTTWEDGTEESQTTARLTTDGVETALDLAVDGHGMVRSVAFDRWGDPDGSGTFAWHRFGMDAIRHGTFGGLTIPVAGVAGWHHGTDRWPETAFFRYRITDVTPIAPGKEPR